MKTCSVFTVLLGVFTLTACGKPETAPAPSSAAAVNSKSAATESAQASPVIEPATAEIKVVDAAGFTLGEYLPPLDSGKIEIATPDNWKPMPRDSKYVVRFAELKSGGGLPRIEVLVEESKIGGITDLTQANVADFAAAVAKDLDESATAVVEPPIPMVIGSVPCARYVSKLKLKIGAGTLLVERQTLALVHAGRLYKINLLVELDKLIESRDAAYAVCAGVRFPAAESQPATE